MESLFVDTSGWCSLFHRGDNHHQEALQIWEMIRKERTPLFTSDYVFDETITILRKRAGYPASERGGDILLASLNLNILSVGKRETLLAWDFYRKYRDHDFSFTDCTSFALMRENKITLVWTTDSDFSKVGFRVLGGAGSTGQLPVV